MYIGAWREDGEVRIALKEEDVFSSFLVVIDGMITVEELHRALEESHAGAVVDGEAFINVDWVVEQATKTPSWRSSFDEMLLYALNHGWTDENYFSVRAHVEKR
jgi:hypothetical protein